MRLTSLMLSVALLALCVISARADEPPNSADPLAQLLSTNPYLAGPDEAARKQLDAECLQLDRRCLRFLHNHPDSAQRALPDNPEYWRAYATVLAAPALRTVLPSSQQDRAGALMGAAKTWLVRQFAIEGRLDPAELQQHLAAHRRHLAGSTLLIDSMVHLAALGITLSSVNAALAQALASGAPVPTALLEPLGRSERSLGSALAGEIAYAGERITPEIDPALLEDLDRSYAYVTERSEAGWRDFWSAGVDTTLQVPGLLYPQDVPELKDYLMEIRSLDAAVHVLRGLAEIYAGHTSPGIPAIPPLPLWDWEWRESTATLCLVPVNVHWTLTDANPVCLEVLLLE